VTNSTMKKQKLLLVVCVVLLLLTGCAATTASQLQITATSSLGSGTIPAQPSETGVPTIFVRPTFRRDAETPAYPSLTPFATLTPSGRPLLATDRESIKHRLERLKNATIAGFKTTILPNQVYDFVAYFEFVTANNITYTVKIHFERDPTIAHGEFLDKSRGAAWQHLTIGDEAVVDGTNWICCLGMMRYQNVIVLVYAQQQGSEDSVPLPNEQVIAVLKDVYEQLLKP
jgi:hypothetical protein